MKKNKSEVQEPTIAELQQKLAYETQRAATYRQQRDNTTSQLQDLDARAGIEIATLQAQLKQANAKIAELQAAKA
jgi:uncharacterized coiled-coil protein SlyX